MPVLWCLYFDASTLISCTMMPVLWLPVLWCLYFGACTLMPVLWCRYFDASTLIACPLMPVLWLPEMLSPLPCTLISALIQDSIHFLAHPCQTCKLHGLLSRILGVHHSSAPVILIIPFLHSDLRPDLCNPVLFTQPDLYPFLLIVHQQSSFLRPWHACVPCTAPTLLAGAPLLWLRFCWTLQPLSLTTATFRYMLE